MIVKSFEGVNMKDALQAVKSEFGTDAVILSTKEKIHEDTGLKIVEVRAASAEIKKTSSNALNKTKTENKNMEHLEKKIDLIERKVSSVVENMITKAQIQHLEGGLQEIKLFVLESLKNKEGSILEGLPNHLVSLETMLKFTGMNDNYITKLMQHLMSIPAPKANELSLYDSEEDFYKSQAIKWAFKKIKISEKWENKKNSTNIHAFIGPTGAGKTMTLAKIANSLKNEFDGKVLVICYDNNRIAASDQLRIYSKVLNIKFENMTDAKELPNLMLKHRDANLILIDTAGRCPKVEEELIDLKDLGDQAIPIDFHLVLPTTEKEMQLDKTIRGFSELGIDSLIFSKLDESWTFGEIFNLSQKWNLPLSYFTTGQEFPNDIEKATRERVVERIFGI